MTSSRPYLIRAMYQWIVDNNMTPHMLVDASGEDVQIPRQYVENGKIVLNIGPVAAKTLALGDDNISFSARFGGTPMNILVPPSRVLAVYSRENGKGMMFSEEENLPPSPAPDNNSPLRAHLKVVK